MKECVNHSPLHSVLLRDVTDDDLPVFFEQQLDVDANRMAAFTAKDPTDREVFTAHWAKIRNDESITLQAILVDGQVAGHIAFFHQLGKPSVSYWIGKEHWAKGIATEALRQFLTQISARPLYARVAKDNLGSIRVLEKSGFMIHGEDKGFSHVRGEEVEEYIMELSG